MVVKATIKSLIVVLLYTLAASVALSNDESNSVAINSVEHHRTQAKTTKKKNIAGYTAAEANPKSDSTKSGGTKSDNAKKSNAKTAELKLNRELVAHLYSLDTLPTNQSHTLSLTDGQVTIVTFFASWCPPCFDEFQALNELNRELEAGISIVAVNVFEEFDDNDIPRMQQFLKATNPTFVLLKGTKKTLELFDGVNRIPTLYAFDKNGTKAFTFIHVRDAVKRSVDFSELKEAILPLL